MNGSSAAAAVLQESEGSLFLPSFAWGFSIYFFSFSPETNAQSIWPFFCNCPIEYTAFLSYNYGVALLIFFFFFFPPRWQNFEQHCSKFKRMLPFSAVNKKSFGIALFYHLPINFAFMWILTTIKFGLAGSFFFHSRFHFTWRSLWCNLISGRCPLAPGRT